MTIKNNLFRVLGLTVFLFFALTNAIAQQDTSIKHTVAKGETLYAVARMYKVPVAKILEMNSSIAPNQVLSIGQILNIPNEQSEWSQWKFHTVSQGETVYSLTNLYELHKGDLVAANPGIDKGNLQIGQVIRIPLAPAIVNNVGDVVRADRQPNMRLTNVFSNLDTKKKGEPIRVAVMLPFMLKKGGESSQIGQRMLEYYEGFLLAVDSLKNQGYNFDIHTYDTGSEKKEIDDIIVNPELDNVDVIFGPFYENHIEMAADFANARNIKLVIPFSRKDEQVFDMPHVFQINTPQAYVYAEVYSRFYQLFSDYNIIFVDAGTQSDTESKAPFITGLKKELRKKKKSYVECEASAELLRQKSVAGEQGKNLYIPNSGSVEALRYLIPQLQVLNRDVETKYNVNLFGYPEWQAYTSRFLDSYFELNTYFYSSFFTNNLLPEPRKFTKDYLLTYGHGMHDTYPKYGMLGFDTGYYFLKGLSLYRGQFEDKIDQFKVTEIQTGFDFQRVSNWGGLINKRIFFVHYTPNFELLKMVFD
ncbi:MAG: LysM peptidoglycan-binding domain-containing protein [Bacteroidaceae bacterium]